MSRLIPLFVCAVLTAACGAPQEDKPVAPVVKAADLVLRGGTVASVDPQIGTVQAIAVNGSRITALGTDAEISPFIGPDTRLIELDGRFAMPGFIEGHGHFLSFGQAQQILDLAAVNNWEEIVQMVAVAADKAKPGEWILGRGWHQDKWDKVPDGAIDGVPANDTLNRISPDNPVFLGHASGHAAFANEAALAAADIGNDTPDPSGGTIVRSADGKATGLLRETAQRLVAEPLARETAALSPEQVEINLRERAYLAGEAAIQNGITSFQDAGSGFGDIDFFRMLELEGALPVRLYVMVRGESNTKMAELLPHYLMPADDNDFLAVRSIKRVIDGALGTHGAWLLEPYVDMTDTAGLVLDSVEDIQRTAEIALEHGYQLNTHAIGDRANRETLDIYERAFDSDETINPDLRWRIEHAQHLDPADVPRFAELGVVASMQGVHCTSDGPWIPQRLGNARAELTSYRWRDLIDRGAVVGNGTDVPIESINPIASFYASVSRVTRTGEPFFPAQAMTRMEALQSYTINNAFAAFEEQQKGSLTPGKLADIVVLSQNILTVPDDDIPGTRIDLTIIGGEVVYERE